MPSSRARRSRIRLLAACVALAVAALSGAASAQSRLIAWRAAERDDGTRFVLELSDATEFKIGIQDRPMRLIVSLQGASGVPGSRLAPVGTIKGARADRVGDGVNLVLEVARPVKLAEAFLLTPSEGRPYRLVLDIVPATRAEFLALGQLQPNATPKPVPPPIPTPDVTPLPPPPPPPPPPPAPPPPPPPPVIAPKSSIPPPFSAPAVSSPNNPVPNTRTLREPGKAPTVIVPLAPPEAPSPAPSPPPSPPPPLPPISPQSQHKAPIVASQFTVAIDAGHGGIDPGAVSRAGVQEKTITLAMALEIRRQLDERGRFRALLTRDDDRFIRLRDRVALARAGGAQLFVSLHADVLTSGTLNGASIYTLSATASDREAEALAASENKADVIAGYDLSAEAPEVSNILIDLAQRETNQLSADFAERLVRELSPSFPLVPKPHRAAGFAVLTAPDIPSVLIEMGYLSSREDQQKLESPEYRRRLAATVVRAIEAYAAARGGQARN